MSERKFLRYFGYAVGEIVLIVVGILIALQINEWAGDREDRSFERKTLAQIRDNLQLDHAMLSEVHANRRAAIRAVDSILGIEDPANPDAELELWLADIMQFDRFNSITNAYDVLKSRGLDIVRDDDVRSTLGVYYDVWAKEILLHNRDLETSFFDFWIPIVISDIETFEWDNKVVPYDPQGFLSNKRYRNIIKLERDNHQGAADNLEEMINVNEKLQGMIDKEFE